MEELKIPYEIKVVSTHRTLDRMYEYSNSAEKRELEVIIAGAGGAAHLPGLISSMTLLPCNRNSGKIKRVRGCGFITINSANAKWSTSRYSRN